jgi:hypothetical protein
LMKSTGHADRTNVAVRDSKFTPCVRQSAVSPATAPV